MKRTTVKSPDDLDARLPRRRSPELTREAVEAHLGAGTGRRRLLATGGTQRPVGPVVHRRLRFAP